MLDAWNLAFRDVTGIAKKNIHHITCRNKRRLILLPGQYQEERTDRTLSCKAPPPTPGATGANVECTHISDKIDVVTSKWLTVEGAARCPAATMDVEEFPGRGGALALRTSTKVRKWTSNYGKLLFYNVLLLHPLLRRCWWSCPPLLYTILFTGEEILYRRI